MARAILFTIEDAIGAAKAIGLKGTRVGFVGGSFARIKRAASPLQEGEKDFTGARGHQGYFEQHIIVRGDCIDLDSLERAIDLPDFDEHFIWQPSLGPGHLQVFRTVVSQLREYLTAKTA